MRKLLLSCCLSLTLLPFAQATSTVKLMPLLPAVEFRNKVSQYVRQLAEHRLLQTPAPQSQALDQSWDNGYLYTHWAIKVALFYQGKKIAQGETKHGAKLSQVTKEATDNALNQLNVAPIDVKELAAFRFQITFSYPPKDSYSFIEYQGEGLELLGDRIALRTLDTDLIKEQIVASQHYLLRIMHPKIHGFFKKYDAKDDKASDSLLTIYTASSLYTLLKLYQFNHDETIEKNFKPIADFILSMQITEGKNTGGFYYAYHPDSQQKSCRVVVGSTAKTIFTLLELARFYHDDRYLLAAKRAGDWLVTMVKPDGQVVSEATCTHYQWHYNQHQSFLYTGQVLAALSRLYKVTKEQRYYDNATKIAERIVQLTKQKGAFVGDDFRPPNTISTSWIIMALLDYTKMNQEPIYREIITKAATEILARQINNPDDAYNHGRYLDTMTTSGNGWINEVLSELEPFCYSQNLPNCKRYRDAMLLTTRWLLQNTYTAANSYDLKNPSQAMGGFMRNFISQSVRTDAVCHGLNSLINLMTILGPNQQVLATLAARPFDETLGLLRIGNS